MKFVIQKTSDFKSLTTSVISNEENAYKKLRSFAERASIYGFPLFFSFWFYLGWPEIIPEKQNLSFEMVVIICFFALAVTPFLHETFHLLALPKKIKLDDTYFIVRINGIRSGLLVKIGGITTRNEYIWTSVLPLVVLSGIPFVLLILGYKMPLWCGFIACSNLSLSTLDIMQAATAYLTMDKNDIFR